MENVTHTNQIQNLLPQLINQLPPEAHRDIRLGAQAGMCQPESKVRSLLTDAYKAKNDGRAPLNPDDVIPIRCRMDDCVHLSIDCEPFILGYVTAALGLCEFPEPFSAEGLVNNHSAAAAHVAGVADLFGSVQTVWEPTKGGSRITLDWAERPTRNPRALKKQLAAAAHAYAFSLKILRNDEKGAVIELTSRNRVPNPALTSPSPGDLDLAMVPVDPRDRWSRSHFNPEYLVSMGHVLGNELDHDDMLETLREASALRGDPRGTGAWRLGLPGVARHSQGIALVHLHPFTKGVLSACFGWSRDHGHLSRVDVDGLELAACHASMVMELYGIDSRFEVSDDGSEHEVVGGRVDLWESPFLRLRLAVAAQHHGMRLRLWTLADGTQRLTLARDTPSAPAIVQEVNA